MLLLTGCVSTLDVPSNVPEKVARYCENRGLMHATTIYAGWVGVVERKEKQRAAFNACLYEQGY
jgi:hypothetical protein